MNVRALAARVLGQVLGEGRSLATALPSGLERAALKEHGLLQELCYGVCRWHPQLQALLHPLLTRPLDPREHTIRALLLIGIYQLWHLRIPEHAAVAETVTAARQIKKPWAAGLTNAVLRTALRRREQLTAALKNDPEACTAHPRWLLQRLQQDWPNDWPAIISANNDRPPFTLRVNRRHHDRESYRKLLMTISGQTAVAVHTPHPPPLASRESSYVETALTLSTAVEPAALPGFSEGWVSIQDAAAQFAAPLLDAQPGMRVLDACAAPGGKTGHLLEYAAHLDLTALDQNAARLEQVADNLHRLQFKARLAAGDARQPADWWDGVLYDRILLDAPCSATGVIRRHPDIKLLRRDSDIAVLANQQQTLLASLWPLLRPAGRLLYATCSVIRQENEQVVERFLADQPDAEEQPIIAPWGHPQSHGRQILPGEAGMDGFYYAVLIKRQASVREVVCQPDS